jgi:hypothetical protein
MDVGRTATSSLRLVDVAAYDAAVCRPARVRGLRVAPPDADPAEPALFVPLDATACTATPPSAPLRVRTLTAR